ncbi:MAG TPA: redoxin domain-containing protein [Planctomycetaceae bacterium]|jgi:peroxiredoxin|nr:redoxin domain-containing protein [Planctomycetaceae bacterium]
MQSFKKRSEQPLKSRARTKRSLPFALVLVFAGTVPAANAQQAAPAVLNAKAPELEERPSDEWLNSRPLKLSELRGQVVVLHFWTFGCINCRHNDAAYKAWHQKYSGKGVTMIGVHTPETERERDPKRLKRSIEERGLRYPIVVDQDGKTWKSWDNRWWPSIYLIDKKGFVRYRWDGELNWKGAGGKAIMEKKIAELLTEEISATANN